MLNESKEAGIIVTMSSFAFGSAYCLDIIVGCWSVVAGVMMQTLSSSSSPLAPKSRLDEIFKDVLKLDPSTINDGMTMNDVSMWDSLRHMELILAVEQKFGFELTFDEISTMGSIGGIRKLVDSKLST